MESTKNQTYGETVSDAHPDNLLRPKGRFKGVNGAQVENLQWALAKKIVSDVQAKDFQV